MARRRQSHSHSRRRTSYPSYSSYSRRRISRWAYFPLALPLVILMGVVVFANVKPAPAAGAVPPGTRGNLVWGDGIFAKRVEVAAWLGLHGGSYRVWAPHHPAALRLLPLRSAHRATSAR